MKNESTTIACRVPAGVKEQVSALAATMGMSPSDWIRDAVMQALHSATKDPSQASANAAPHSSSACIAAVEAQITELKDSLGGHLHSIHDATHNVKATINAKAEDHFDELIRRIQSLEESHKSQRAAFLHAITCVHAGIIELKHHRPSSQTGTTMISNEDQKVLKARDSLRRPIDTGDRKA